MPTKQKACKRPKKLDAFTKSYIETALRSSMDNADESGGEPLARNYAAKDIACPTLVAMVKDCEKFQKENAKLLASEDDEQTGHDFWLTRNGHGAGFWDGDYEDRKGDLLTKASEKFGEVDLYIGDDRKIHGT